MLQNTVLEEKFMPHWHPAAFAGTICSSSEVAMTVPTCSGVVVMVNARLLFRCDNDDVEAEVFYIVSVKIVSERIGRRS